jgi:DNA-binding NtrC family response regulator
VVATSDQRQLLSKRLVGHGLAGVRDQIAVVAPVDTSVLILGESGSGKEVVARLIHDLSPRVAKPYEAANCARFRNESMLESTLFGHERGSFTTAIQRVPGLFEQAEGGTLFLDEIADASDALQAALLRVVEERVFKRVGGTAEIRADVRLIAATNKDVRLLRPELFFRLNTYVVKIPPLRARRGDVPELVEHLKGRIAEKRTGIKNPELAPDALICLQEYNWPGNVRQLSSVLEGAMIKSLGTTITPELIRSLLSASSVPDPETSRGQMKIIYHLSSAISRKKNGRGNKEAVMNHFRDPRARRAPAGLMISNLGGGDFATGLAKMLSELVDHEEDLTAALKRTLIPGGGQ